MYQKKKSYKHHLQLFENQVEITGIEPVTF
jgi:hypothetical protein